MSTASNAPGTNGEMPRLISVDDHVVEPADVWTSRLPQKYKDKGPRVVIEPQGKIKMVRGAWQEVPGDGEKMAAWWHYEDHRYQIKQLIACPGLKPEEVSSQGVTYDDIAPGCYQPKARVADMDKNHIEASLCFPNYPRFCGQLFSERKDLELGKLCVEAYNDWMIEEWCGDSDGRLIPLCLIPIWDVDLAASRSSLPGWGSPRLSRATGIHSSQSARRRIRCSACTSDRARRRSSLQTKHSHS
jgi:hypothetical protein